MLTRTIVAAVLAFGMSGSSFVAAQAATAPTTMPTAVRSADLGSAVTVAAGCARYPGSVYTVTRLRLKRDQVPRGRSNVARVKVNAQRGTARGSVKVIVLPTSGAGNGHRLYHRLNDNGVARVRLPANLKRGKYGVRAKYRPSSCSRYAKSASDVKYYRVTRRR